MWTFKQLETFYWCAKLKHFTLTAERINATQSTVSSRINQLEERMGVTLFHRYNKSVTLTHKGEQLFAYAARMLDLADEIQTQLVGTTTPGGSIRLGVTEAIAETWLAQFARDLHERYPELSLELEISLTGDLLNKLHTGTLDLLFVPSHLSETEYTARSLGFLDFFWMASPELGIHQDPVTPPDLAHWPIITLQRTAYQHVTIERWFKDNRASFARLVKCSSLSVMASLTNLGLGVSVLPPAIYQEEIDKGELAVLNTDPAIPPVEFLAVRPESDDNWIADMLIDLAVEVSTFDPPY